MSKNFRKLRACPRDALSCAQYAVFGIFPKSRYRQTCWVNSIHLLLVRWSIWRWIGSLKRNRWFRKFASEDGIIDVRLLSAFPPCNVDADGRGGGGSLDDTSLRLVGEMGDSWLCLCMLGNVTEGIMVMATALIYRSASWTKPSIWGEREPIY